MAWTDSARRRHARAGGRYAIDPTDCAWAPIAPSLPAPAVGVASDDGASHDGGAVVDATLYLASTGCRWRMPPKEVPPVSTVQRHFYAWRDRVLWEETGDAPVGRARETAGRGAQPTAGVIDSQGVETTESGGPGGYDAGKRIEGRKRHILADTLGLLVAALVHAADVQDRDGAPSVLDAAHRRWPRMRHVFADGGHAGPKLCTALADRQTGRPEDRKTGRPEDRKTGRVRWSVEIVKRSDAAAGFEFLPRRWVVERTPDRVRGRLFAWLGRCRRLARDWETSIASATAFLLIAHVRMLTRRIARRQNET